MDRISRTLCVIFALCLELTMTCAETIEFRMLEENIPGIYVGNIQEKYNTNRDQLRFSLLKDDNSPNEDLFAVDEISGNLTAVQSIDSESLCEFVIDCRVTLQIAIQTERQDGFFDVVYCDVVIDDINDNAPTYFQDSYTLPITEAVLTGASFTFEGARDIDTSAAYSIKSYSLEPKVPGDALPFSVRFTTKLDGGSTVKLIVNEILDREIRDSYEFYVIAKDGGSPPKQGSLFVTVTITDTNDQYPEFDQTSYSVRVKEEVAKDVVILTLNATDKDIGANGIVRYRLSPNQHTDHLKYFTMGELTGQLSIKERLNSTDKKYFKLIVDAIDQGDSPLMTQTFVEVTVLDTSNSPPRIKQTLLPNPQESYASISEYANVGAVVAYIAVEDQDSGRNGDVDCVIESNDMFNLPKYDNKEYKVTVAKSLDREIAISHDVTVICMDKGVPPLSSEATFTVQIAEENDNAPTFRQQRYFVNMDENNELGDRIIIVSAFDLDSGINKIIEYSLDKKAAEYAFVDPDTGEIMANKIFDKESKDGQGFSLTVYAKDKGEPALTGTASVLVTIHDVNDEKPVFDQGLFRFWIDENQPADSSVGRLTSKDNDMGSHAVTRYAMKPDGTMVPFVIIEDGTIKTDRELDREERSQYTFDVMAIDVEDETLFDTATVTVFISDENDNGPMFEYPRRGNDTVRVLYHTTPGTVVCRVLAQDKDDPSLDNARLRYSLQTVNSTSFFTIDASNGNIILKAPLENTDTIDKTFLLTIHVSDSGDVKHTASATLRAVIVADNGTLPAIVGKENKNFIIAAAVGAATVLISCGIIVTICIIRNLDSRRRRNNKGHQKALSENMYSRNNEEVDNIYPLPMDGDNGEKKRKGVSFSLDGQGHIEGHVDCQITQNSEDQGNRSFDQMLLEPPPQYQQLVPPSGKLDDCHSDMSGESNGDSGKGGSDDDLQINNLSFTRDEAHRSKDRWNNSRIPSGTELRSFPTRYSHGNNSLPRQKIVPFSFNKSTPAYNGNSLINNLSPPPSASSYMMPTFYEDESRSSSGFHSSIDSNSNLNLNNLRSGGKITLNRGNMPDCVV
ncbi:protocadherin-7-like [Mya arenaria]|uniref:protocadherin-7-like n=1 Tax=Mya arenaria TaxID=6604 RepID=UPI0022E904FD|nr:protocadherin-7-like [Mya arenaria]